MVSDIVKALRQPEYTGESRCLPCTAVNSVLALLATVAVTRKSRGGGLLVAAVSAALLYLRGYIVPGTPTLTKRYLPPTVLRWFGKDPEPDVAAGFGGGDQSGTTTDGRPAGSEGSAGTSHTATSQPTASSTNRLGEPANHEETDPVGEGGDLEAFFLRHSVLDPCQGGDDLELTEEFETAWVTEARDRADSEITPEAVAEAFGVAPDEHELDLKTRGETQVLESESNSLGQWPSRAALAADVAASDLFASRMPQWRQFDAETRGRILNGLRMFLETCPSTGGDVRLNEDVVESCCSSHKVLAVTCVDTDERLFEHYLPANGSLD
jgi:hypothetical protein